MIKAAAAAKASRYKDWTASLTKGQLEEIMAIKVDHRAGDIGLPARTLAKAILDDFDRQGIRVCSLHTLSAWLNAE